MLWGKARRATIAWSVLVAVMSLAGPAPAEAHAKIVGSDPVDGAVLDVAPDRVTLLVDAKPATLEGDPLQVFGPDGRRIDSGDTAIDDDGHRLSVGLDPTAARRAGRYNVVYRVISADTHLIAGRLQFETRDPVPGVATLTAGGPGPGTDGAGRLHHGWPIAPWPAAVVGGVVLLVIFRGGRRYEAEPLGHWQRARDGFAD